MIVFRDNTIIQPDGYTQLPVTQLCYDKENSLPSNHTYIVIYTPGWLANKTVQKLHMIDYITYGLNYSNVIHTVQNLSRCELSKTSHILSNSYNNAMLYIQ